MSAIAVIRSKFDAEQRGPAIAAVMILLMVVLPQIFGGSLSNQNFIDISLYFAGTAPIAIAIGLTMIMGEFDLSVVSVFTLGGIITLKVGDSSGLVMGFVAGAAAGVLIGVIQGAIISLFRISSVPVTLAGYLLVWGVCGVIAGKQNLTITTDKFGVAEALQKEVFSVFTVGALIVLAGALLIHLLIQFTRFGSQLRAVGGDRRASRVAGINVKGVIVATFAISGAVAALGGGIQALAYSSIDPTVNFSPLLNAVMAAILGGVAITGARGTPLGIATGVIALAALTEILLALELDPEIATVISGGFLMLIALASAPRLNVNRAIVAWQRRRRDRRLEATSR